MDAEIIPETVVLLIPLSAVVGFFIVRFQRIRAEAAGRLSSDDKGIGELRDAVLRLESRVGNLERAVTTAETERKYAL